MPHTIAIGDQHRPPASQGETSSFTVPIHAYRDPPVLSLPSTIAVGNVMCGNEQVSEVGFQNHGGPGRFKLVASGYWPHSAEQAPADIMAAGAFR